MSDRITITLDGRRIEAEEGQTILQAAEAAGVYIPRLCAHPELEPFGGCRVCTVMVNGRAQAACTQPAAEGLIIESESKSVRDLRRSLVEMLFVEGNHFCIFCEKSGNCELQALAYRLGITAPRYPYLNPERQLDASHPEVLLDRNRCVLCARCVRASRDLDGKHVFQFVGRGPRKSIAVNAEAELGDTELEAADRAVEICPVGAILRKRIGYALPVGKRLYDHRPIGSETEARNEGGE